jgi:hypothetical protein
MGIPQDGRHEERVGRRPNAEGLQSGC